MYGNFFSPHNILVHTIKKYTIAFQAKCSYEKWGEEKVRVAFSDKDFCEIRNVMRVKTFQIAKVNTDKTSMTGIIAKTIHCLILAFRVRAQPS